MNRMKYRAWDTKEKRFYNWNQILNNFDHFYFDDRYEFMQFTGLKDINGKEIYEGDRVVYADEKERIPAVIVYSGCSFSTKCTVTNDLGDIYGFNLEIIGNIYENNIKQIK